MIKLHDVSVIRQGRPTLDNVSFEINKSEQWAIIGPNGAGKSTMLSLFATSTLPSKGDVFIMGCKVGTIEVSKLREHMGYVTAHHQLEWPMTARDIVLTAFTNTLETPMRWVASDEQLEIGNAQLEKFGLTRVADTTWRGLSQGELGRCFLARAALTKPSLLLLDEPAAGLDLAAREQVLDLIRELRVEDTELTSVMITHHLEELPSTTTHAALMAQGKIVVQGPAEEILTSENLSETFGIPIIVNYSHGRWSTRSGK
ncbi:ABC transporter ATP-binding protein [Aurantimicrobium minutum]|uniref:ABC transporter ATP-binding protein n=1 Tax=Aurantimicrobium minutum TaxID=708131 RepID=UPI002473657B|nr:ATP-binding cassette domain-containing protein [Aurantimicrobium minutum]